MTDFFALLEEPRRPWLAGEALKRKFLSLSAHVHPDRVHNAGPDEKEAAQRRYTELNAAYRCLLDPKERLRHLLELETGTRPKQVERVPQELMDRLMEVSRRCREADVLLAEKSSTDSPLLQVQLFERNQACIDRLNALQTQVQGWNDEALRQLKAIDESWRREMHANERAAMVARLEELYRLLSYFARWSSQIQERVVGLSL
jgi:DnaJ-domain-containing protein 1